MKKLTDDLNRILAGLADQDARDDLPLEQKGKLIHPGESSRWSTFPVTVSRSPTHSPRRFAVFTRRVDPGEALTYAIDACRHLDAQPDVLFRGTIGNPGRTGFETRLQHAGAGPAAGQLLPLPRRARGEG